MKIYLRFGFAAILLVASIAGFGQGYNHVWLFGSTWNNTYPKGRMTIDSVSYNYQTEFRDMVVQGTQATICDSNGNFLMSSNGVWIANANNDTMINGAGLNPSWDVNAFPHGLLNINGNVIVPCPGDSSKFLLFHQAQLYSNLYVMGIYQSIIDLSLDSGLGGVVLKNDTLLVDSISMGLAACKHANGRDWWLVAIKDSSNSVFVWLLTPFGVSFHSMQSLGYTPFAAGNGCQITFSQDGSKSVMANYDNPINRNSSMILVDFDRCSGLFSNTQSIPLTNHAYLWGLAFSPSGQFVYTCSSENIFQVNTTTLQVDTVAVYDGFSYPLPGAATTFWNMYLAANGKIYTTSGNSVQHLHEMNFPDSSGIACDVQQHNIFLNMWNFRSVPNHPNYYLGRLQGSLCDTLQWTGFEETQHDFRFRIYPNPVTSNSLHIGYFLPQNKKGLFQIYDVNGKVVFKYPLPQWSNEQEFVLPNLANGIYNASIISDNKRVSKTIAIINE